MRRPCFTRREVISLGLKAAAGTFLFADPLFSSLSRGDTLPRTPVSVVTDPDQRSALRSALKSLGGMGEFISKHDVVLVKPNIGWDRNPAQAANTDPGLVVAIIESALEAGAKEVRVFDRTCNEPRRCYINSGIEPAVKEFAEREGVKDRVRIYHVERRKFVKVEIREGEVLDSWPLYRDALEVDRVVNVPVAKHHSLAGYTLALKNMMGIMGGNRGQIHWRLSPALSDLNSQVKTHLTVIDGVRILLRNGPSGGNVKDVEKRDTVIVSPNPVAADAVAAKILFGIDPSSLSHVREASRRGLGPIEEGKIEVRRS